MKLTPLLALASSRSALLAAGLLTLQGCEYVHDVVVPANDSNPPLVTATVWDPVTQEHTWASDKTFRTCDPDEMFVALGAGFDTGGVRELLIQGYSVREYLGAGGLITVIDSVWDIEKVQSGGVGDTVDNGLWGGIPIQPGAGANFYEHKELIYAIDWYDVIAEDFAGNKIEIDGASFVYEP